MFIRMKESKGFTLVELMIVVAIIGILAAVAVPYYQRYIQKSRLASKVFPGVHAIETNVGAFYSFQQVFPSAAADVAAMAADANTQCVTPTFASNMVTYTIKGTGTACKPLSALNGQQLIATAATSGGKILGWALTGDLATNLGLSGEN